LGRDTADTLRHLDAFDYLFTLVLKLKEFRHDPADRLRSEEGQNAVRRDAATNATSAEP